MRSHYSPQRMGLAILSGGLAFVGTASAAELLLDGSFENAVESSNPIIRIGGVPNPTVGQGWSTFSTYLYSTQYTMPGPVNSGVGYLRPYPSGVGGIAQSSDDVFQTVSLLTGTLTPAKIDAGQASFTMSAWFSSYLTQGDHSELTLQFLDESGQEVGTSELLGGFDFVQAIPTGENSKYTNAKEWAQDLRTGTIPARARTARVTLQSTPVAGSPDGYVDLVSLDVVDTTLTIPALTGASPGNNAAGVGPVVTLAVTLQDRVTSVNPATIRLFLNDVPVTPTITASQGRTEVTYAAGLLPALSSQTYRIIFGDTSTPSLSQTNSFTFTVASYLTLPESLATPLGSEDTTKPGFNVNVFQVDTLGTGEVIKANLEASIGLLESVLAGHVGSNKADLSTASQTNQIVVPGVINWVNGTGVAANFPDDTAFPGIPGTTSSEESFVHEVTTFLRFPTAGFYQLGVNNEDAYRLTAGGTGVQTLRIKGATEFVVPCVPIATNITGLSFGGSLPATPLTAPIVYGTPTGSPDEGCDLAGKTALAGKIVLIDRDATTGLCTSADKAEQAQLAGAVAVILITPGDGGYPPRLGDANPNVRIPVLVISDTFAGANLKAQLQQSVSLTGTIQTDTEPRISEWDGPKGFGAVDVTSGFAVPKAGVYPMRLVSGQENGRANLEFFSIKANGSRVLVNDPTDPEALRAFRTRTVVVAPPQFNAPTLVNGSLTLSWTGSGVLQEAPGLNGPWIPAANQSNPQSVPTTAAGRVYRVVQ